MLTCIRGLPGSGKSTYARTLPGRHVEADDYFMKDGVYQFDRTQLKAAHELCQRSCLKSLEQGLQVVVANTFVRRWELLTYWEMARNFHVPFIVVRMTGQFQSIHNVPSEVIERMASGFEPWKGEIIL
jgi:predicted kinase